MKLKKKKQKKKKGGKKREEQKGKEAFKGVPGRKIEFFKTQMFLRKRNEIDAPENQILSPPTKRKRKKIEKEKEKRKKKNK